ncbi:hypothetical protein FA15DRAFT_665495 [Coprinopsis marcescibilis]|uniref:Uncharacterized protein n=1 Tax=Coprinopsis marcescibilis TaxID=230819 RepID=A0A5C3L5I7_COPMA|nr:hypothetical protein FA15DRAFT_665495 [Coprinopsis marcescibilis]
MGMDGISRATKGTENLSFHLPSSFLLIALSTDARLSAASILTTQSLSAHCRVSGSPMSLLLEPEPTVLQDNPYSISLPEPASLAEMKAESKRLDLSYELPFDYWTSVGINLVDMGLKADDKGDYVTAFVLLARAFILLGQKLRNHPNYRRKARGETWKQVSTAIDQ